MSTIGRWHHEILPRRVIVALSRTMPASALSPNYQGYHRRWESDLKVINEKDV